MTFADILAAAIKKTGKKMTEVAEELDIPYRTIQDWRAGRRVPNEFTQRIVIEQIEKIK